MRKRHIILWATALWLLITGSVCRAGETGLRLPLIISDHMMLQAGQADPIWGWAPAGTAVKIDFKDARGKSLASAKATADASGKWSASLPPQAPGTAGQMLVTAGPDSKTIQDVLVGENWFCSGQSNMGYNLNAPSETPSILARAKQESTDAHGALRIFMCIRHGNVTPLDDVEGEWTVAAPDNVGICSTAAWEFAVALRDKLKEPVAVIVAAVGGTAAETWMPQATFKSLSVAPAMEARENADAAKSPGSLEQADQATMAWFRDNPPSKIIDNILQGHRPLGSPLPGAPKDPEHPKVLYVPARYYNGMVNGLIPYGIKGILWYQGDANSPYFQEYPELIKGLITSWRKLWGSELPFYYVETQNMMAYQTEPIDDGEKKKSHAYTPFLREAQGAALALPKTGVATAIDLNKGEESTANPHFPNKQPLGQRLANLAAEEIYGQNLGEVHSPAYSSMKVEGSKVRISLSHASGLRAINGGPLKGFAIRGGSGPWIWGDAQISGGDILVSSSEAPSPTAVRYAWAQNPLLSVENGAGLPLQPFRTDKDPAPPLKSGGHTEKEPGEY